MADTIIDGLLLYEDKLRWVQVTGGTMAIHKGADPSTNVRKELRLGGATVLQEGNIVQLTPRGKEILQRQFAMG